LLSENMKGLRRLKDDYPDFFKPFGLDAQPIGIDETTP
jgi:hypothetical protein